MGNRAEELWDRCNAIELQLTQAGIVGAEHWTTTTFQRVELIDDSIGQLVGVLNEVFSLPYEDRDQNLISRLNNLIQIAEEDNPMVELLA